MDKHILCMKCTSRLARQWASIVCLMLWCVAANALEGTLIVANRTGGSISFIDLTQNVEIARVPIGPIIPHEVAVSPDGRLVLTSEYGPEDDHGRHIVLIDVASASILARIDLGAESRPHSPMFLPDGRHAVATMQESDLLALIDLETRSVVRRYPTGGREGHMVRVSPDGSRAYVTSRGAEGTLSVIFLNEERAPIVIRTGRGAEGMDVTPDGREIWVANRQQETISVVDAESLQVVATLDSHPYSGRIEMSPDGGYAIVPNGGGRSAPVTRHVRLWDVAARRPITEVPLPGVPFEGNFGALIHAGIAFVADPGEGIIQMFDLESLGNRTILLDHHESPDGMAWSPIRVDVMTR